MYIKFDHVAHTPFYFLQRKDIKKTLKTCKVRISRKFVAVRDKLILKLGFYKYGLVYLW